MFGNLAFATIALCVAMSALAAEIGGVRLDDKSTVAGRELVLNGAGIRTKLMFKVYVASLYLPSKSTDVAIVLAAAPRRIQLNLLRDLSADQLVDGLIEGLSDSNSPQELAAVKAQTAELVAIMKTLKDVNEKDVVTLDWVDGSTRVGFNGEARGAIAGEPFNKALMRVWLGNKPVQADLKQALLGG
jgi:long-chain acyl-CoA synthetase